MSFLSKISNLRKATPVVPPKQEPVSDKKSNEEEYTILPRNYVREEDPAVRRLKELRRQELLKSGELSKKVRGQSKPAPTRRRKDDDEGGSMGTKFKRKVRAHSAGSSLPSTNAKKAEPLKKLSFDELMKQAENNAQEKPNAMKEPSPVNSGPHRIPKSQGTTQQYVKKIGFKKGADRRNRNSTSPVPEIPTTKPYREEPAPIKLKTMVNGFAKPNEKLRRQLEQRKRTIKPRTEYEDDGSDLDDFIEDDTMESENRRQSQRDTGYDRDEIWAMFNRGKRRSDYAFDDMEDDDMEANEMEILEEEEQARRMARLEDKREEQWLKRHEQEKKRRKRMKD